MPIYFTTLDGTGTVLAILCMAILFSLLFNRFRLPCEIGMLPFGLFIAAILYANDAAISANLLRLDSPLAKINIPNAMSIAKA